MTSWLTARCAGSDADAGTSLGSDQESVIEQKYIFTKQHESLIFDWLRYCCVPDSEFYFSQVFSIYYDTPNLDLYYEKRNSDYIKTKVRLRWYTPLLDSIRDSEIPCYLEVKRKCGIRRTKKRIPLKVSSTKLFQAPFSAEEILELPARVAELDYDPPGILVPIMLIQYTRYRFVDQDSGSRIALDTQIQCPTANARFIPGFPPIRLDAGVLEIKGSLNDLLKSLTAVRDYLTRESFSKYARCYEELAQPLGRRI